MGGFDPKQFQELIAKAQQQAQDLQSQMQRTIVEASSGGGTVTVKMNGQKRLLDVDIIRKLSDNVLIHNFPTTCDDA